jgi:hypothetical protein
MHTIPQAFMAWRTRMHVVSEKFRQDFCCPKRQAKILH